MARKILLADDSVTAQNMGRKILADAGYDVVTVNNGSAALKRIAEIKPDLIVLDVYMPGYSGLEVCQRLKDAAETAHIPVLLTVGKLEPFKPEEARRVRADAHIVKPFEASELLTAITRLEDRMVPQQAEGSRFSNSVSGVERFSGDGGSRKAEGEAEADTGWKSRLRFPSKKKKEEAEPEPEEVATEATFRDFRKSKSKNGDNGKTGAAFTVKAAAPPGQEPGLVPDIPRDITPDELDALSALAAKLDGPIRASEEAAPLADRMVAETPAAVANTQEPAATRTGAEAPVPVAASAAPALEAASLGAEIQMEAGDKIEIPVEHVESGAESAPAASADEVTVNAAVHSEEPAPVDRSDEPGFAARAVEQAAEPKSEAGSLDAVGATTGIAIDETARANAATEEVGARVVELKLEESEAMEAKPELKGDESKGESVEPVAAVVVTASVPAAAEAEELVPSDEELAEALRLLTPATGSADVTTIPSHGTLMAAGQLLVEEAARNAAAGPRWVAEPVALSGEEAAMSLEAEMFRTFAVVPAAVTTAGSGDENRRDGITGVSAIAVAVENRLAEAEKTANANLSAASAAMSAARPLAATTSSVSTEVDGAISDGVEPAVEAQKATAERTVQPAKSTEEPAEEIAAATFADAMNRDNSDADSVSDNGHGRGHGHGNGHGNDNGKDRVQDEINAPAVHALVQDAAESVRETTAAVVVVGGETVNQDSSTESGGGEAMGKDNGKDNGKDKKSNWHQIHTAPASAGASKDAVEEAKQAEGGPKAMAAAAAADGSASGSGSATDAGTIASIVDSVMADLRPRIVEEIAKKLAGK